jgi:hypothetical protein
MLGMDTYEKILYLPDNSVYTRPEEMTEMTNAVHDRKR